MLEKFDSYKDIEAYVKQYCEKEDPDMKDSTRNLITDFLYIMKTKYNNYNAFDLHLKVTSEEYKNLDPRCIKYRCDITEQLDGLLIDKYSDCYTYILQRDSCLYVLRTDSFQIGSLITDMNQRILFVHVNNDIEGKFKRDPSNILYLSCGKRIIFDDEIWDTKITNESEE